MSTTSGDRTLLFPAIVKKYGKPMTHWFALLTKSGGTKYADQVALLQDKNGFSRAHANTVVMYHRGSTTSKRVEGPVAFFDNLNPVMENTARNIFAVIMKKYPKLELVIAWNQPMLKLGDNYIFGLSTSKNHITLLPLSTNAIETFAEKLASFETNKKTFRVPPDWKVNASLLNALVKARLDEL